MQGNLIILNIPIPLLLMSMVFSFTSCVSNTFLPTDCSQATHSLQVAITNYEALETTANLRHLKQACNNLIDHSDCPIDTKESAQDRFMAQLNADISCQDAQLEITEAINNLFNDTTTVDCNILKEAYLRLIENSDCNIEDKASTQLEYNNLGNC